MQKYGRCMQGICTSGSLDACTARADCLHRSRATLARLAFHACAARGRVPFSQENHAFDARRRCFPAVFSPSVRWPECTDFATALCFSGMTPSGFKNRHRPCRRPEKRDSEALENAKCHFDISDTNCGIPAG